MAYTTATLTGTYQNWDGQPASGTVEIIPNSKTLIDAEGDVILWGRVKVTLDETGSFSATLPSTDDETVEPATGRQYTVAAKLRTGHVPAVTGIELAAGEIVDMADVTSAVETTAALSVWLTEEEYEAALAAKADAADLASKADAADVTALDTRVDALEAAPGGVSSVNGEAGDVTLTAADVGADPAGSAAAVAASVPSEAELSATFGTVQDALRPTDRRYEIPPTMVAQANSSSHGWVAASGNTATLTLDDTTYAPLGSQSLKMVSNGSGGAARVDKTGLTFDWTGKSPVVWVMVDDVSKLNGLSLYAGNAGFASYYLWQFAPQVAGVTEMQSGQLVKITLNWGDATVSGTPARNAITSIRFFAQDRSTGAATVRFLGVAAQAEPTTRYPNGVVVFTFDDGRISQYTGARPTLDKYGFPATAYLIAERIDSGASWLTTAQVQDLQNKSGWEVGAHSYSLTMHDQVGGFTAATADELAEDYANLKRWLADRGLHGSDHLAYPQGLWNNTVLDVTRRYYTSARTVWGKSGMSSTWPPADPYRMRTRMLTTGAEATLASIQTAVDRTVANKGMLVITGHALGTVADSLTWLQSDFDSLVAYVAASGAAVRTMGQALRGD